jgi:hypothetical protein
VSAIWCLSRSCACDRKERGQKTENFQRVRITRSHPHAPAPAVHSNITKWPGSTLRCVPLCARACLMEIQFIKVAIFHVQIDQILTFRILASGVEAGQACVIRHSGTHTITLTKMGSMSFTCVAQEAGERSKFEYQSGILISSAISYSCFIGSALHTPWRTPPAHIVASP